MSRLRIAVFAVLLLCILCSACSPAASSADIPAQATSTNLPIQSAQQENLVDLVEQGTVTFRLTSGSINQLGLNLRNTGSQPVQVAIPAGTFFVNDDPQSQNMVVLHEASIPIQPGEQADILLDVACANLHLSEPTRENTFTIRRDPTPLTLGALIDELNSAQVEFPVEQAAVWIVTDDASYDELGMLVKDTRFGTAVINENDAARAMMLVDKTGLNIRRHAIWGDFTHLSTNVVDPDLSDWMDIQHATQIVLDATQVVLDATQAVLDATQSAVDATQSAAEALAAEATQSAAFEAEMAVEATRFSLDETLNAPVVTPLPTVAYPAPNPGEISQFATSASASTEYSNSSWSAMQATGAPNTSECGDKSTAWASSSSSGTDWLLLTYDQALIPTRIVIFETFNPGAITRVEVLDQAGNSTAVYTSRSAKSAKCPNQLVIEVKDITVPVNALRLTLDHRVWSEIDAVQLIGH